MPIYLFTPNAHTIQRNLIRTIRLSTDGSWRFFSTDIDSYFVRVKSIIYPVSSLIDVSQLSLMLADCLLSVGGLMNIKWIIIGHSSCGHYCSAQGAIQQLGAPGVALSNIVSIVSVPRNKVLTALRRSLCTLSS